MMDLAWRTATEIADAVAQGDDDGARPSSRHALRPHRSAQPTLNAFTDVTRRARARSAPRHVDARRAAGKPLGRSRACRLR